MGTRGMPEIGSVTKMTQRVVVKTQPVSIRERAAGADDAGIAGFQTGLLLDLGLIYQHDRNIVLHRIYPVAICTLQGFRILTVFQFLFAGGADQNFQ